MDFMCIWIDYVLVYYGIYEIYEILEILVLDFFQVGYVALMNGSNLMGFTTRDSGTSSPGPLALCICLLVPHNLLIDFRYMKVFRMFRLFLYLYVYIVCCIVFVVGFEERRFVYFEERRFVYFCSFGF